MFVLRPYSCSLEFLLLLPGVQYLFTCYVTAYALSVFVGLMHGMIMLLSMPTPDCKRTPEHPCRHAGHQQGQRWGPGGDHGVSRARALQSAGSLAHTFSVTPCQCVVRLSAKRLPSTR